MFKKMKFLVTCSLVLAVAFTTLFSNTTVYAKDSRALTKVQKERIEKIVNITKKNYDKYGVLPSIATAQAIQETAVGTNRGYYFNYWGISSGAEHFGSLKEANIRYLEVINNGYYKNAPFQKDWKKQIRAILDGGYCQPEGNYYNDIQWIVNYYNLDKYDKEMFKEIKEEKLKEKRRKQEEEAAKVRKKEQLEEFTLVYDPTVPDYSVAMDSKIVLPDTAICIYNEDYSFCSLYESEDGGDTIKGHEIHINIPEYNGMKVHLIVYEGAKG